jgi:L,D-transpeptidase ErfK/SrfK
MRAALAALICAILALPVPAGAQGAIGAMDTYTAREGDTLAHIARDHGLGFVELRAANPSLDPWAPTPGAEVVLPARHILPDAPREGVVINLAEMRLYAFTGPAPLTFPIGIGREGLDTPLGATHVRAKAAGPTWRPTERMRAEDPTLPEAVPPGPDNPLGTHALYLGWPQYAIHGTAKPFGIGRRVSSGCIRLAPPDIPVLFAAVPVGAPVVVVNQPVKVGWLDGALHVEVSPTVEQSGAVADGGPTGEPVALDGAALARVQALAAEHGAEVDWAAVRGALRDARGVPVAVSKPQ